MKTKKVKVSMKMKVKRLWKRLCAGIVADGKLQDTIKGKRDKYGPFAVLLAIGLMASVTSAKAQVGWDGAGARDRVRGEGSAAVGNFARSYWDYATSRDGVITLLDHLNGSDPYGANAAARAIEHSGVPMETGGGAMPGDLIWGSPIIMGPLSGSTGAATCRWGTEQVY